MKKNNGSNLVEYIIPTAIIGLTLGLGLFYIVSDGNLLKYFMSSNKMKLNKSTSTIVIGEENDDLLINPAYKGGEFGGTPEQPVQKCQNGVCKIDFGEFILTGIPENFNEFLTTTGTSGGTEKLVSLITQIAKELENNGDQTGAAQYKDLANLGHFIGYAQAEIENVNKECKKNDEAFCMHDAMKSNMLIKIPENVKELIPEQQRNLKTYDFISTTDLGHAKNLQVTNPELFETLKDSNVSFKALESYTNIMNNPAYSESMKKVTEELYRNVAELSMHFNRQCYIFHQAYDGTQFNIYDPLTGELKSSKATGYNVGSQMNQVLPSTSFGTDLNSRLICTTGRYNAKGKECK